MNPSRNTSVLVDDWTEHQRKHDEARMEILRRAAESPAAARQIQEQVTTGLGILKYDYLPFDLLFDAGAYGEEEEDEE